METKSSFLLRNPCNSKKKLAQWDEIKEQYNQEELKYNIQGDGPYVAQWELTYNGSKYVLPEEEVDEKWIKSPVGSYYSNIVQGYIAVPDKDIKSANYGPPVRHDYTVSVNKDIKYFKRTIKEYNAI